MTSPILKCLLVLAGACLWLGSAGAEIRDRRVFPASTQAPATDVLRIHGTSHADVMAAPVRDFQQRHPQVEVVYTELDGQGLYTRFLREREGGGRPDLLISSSMDLQVALANAGHARPYRSAATRALPAWAHWRHEVIGITYEPVVMVHHREALPAPPRSRQQLLDMLRAPDAPLRGRIGTYDASRSTLGYLLASQDVEFGSTGAALHAALGANDVRLETRSLALLDAVERGDLLLAYNVLGSYAQARIDAGAPLGLVMPEDTTRIVVRTVLIPKTARQAGWAGAFIDHLLSASGQQALARESRLSPMASADGQPFGVYRGVEPGTGVRPIRLGPGLLVYLDALKRRQFLDALGGERGAPSP
ncbi:ABC transporter substrate-binding protein [Luteimonas abyssi]|uniref:ABC transporter substrate-binding protein n=1 Tax=Luteimonas abyssi TaxID=1247514 RepID=UPI000737C54B|nr:ABC transporter substrate-binding protein [Luteimonas abyssi]